jgi:hypothetical protein
MNIRPLGAELFHGDRQAEGQTDGEKSRQTERQGDGRIERQADRQAHRRTDVAKLVVNFRNFAIASKTKSDSTLSLMHFSMQRTVLSLTVPNSPAYSYNVSSIKMNISMKHW